LSALVEAQCHVVLNAKPKRRGIIRLVPMEILIANPEPMCPVMAGVPRFLEGFVGQTPAGLAFNAALAQVDAADDVATALRRIRDAEGTIRGCAREQQRSEA
jgi:hypothetical protein